ncbi:hypothetical protein ABWH96_05260 [Marivirga tractuosa]|uniref:hypothetical protein n=1 Tax=Marivirga tractuosa TaxID=1006 RepID=UPI0035D00225
MCTLKLIKKETYTFEENVFSKYFLPLSSSEFIIQGHQDWKSDYKIRFHINNKESSTSSINAYEQYINHPKGVLVYKDQKLWWHPKNDLNHAVEIKLDATFQNREWITNIETVSVTPRIGTLGLSDCDIIPVNVSYKSFRLNRQLSLLKLDFDKKEASIVFDKYHQFITLNYYDLLKHQGYDMSSIDKNWAFSEEKRTDGVLDNYYDHHAQMLFSRALFKNNKLYIFSTGRRTNYMKYGMDYVCLSILEKSLFNKRYSVKKTLFFQDEDELDSGKNGKEGRFTASAKYCIITPVFTTSDAWKSREKLIDLDTEKLIDIELPRGYKSHHIIDHYENSFWAHGTNKDHQNVITRFEADNS